MILHLSEEKWKNTTKKHVSWLQFLDKTYDQINVSCNGGYNNIDLGLHNGVMCVIGKCLFYCNSVIYLNNIYRSLNRSITPRHIKRRSNKI